MKEFIKKAQDSSANPLTYGTTGAGTLQFLTMETLKRDHNFQASHVPYRSPPQIVTDVVGGHIASSISETGAALSLIVDGKLKALAITASAAHPSLPQVPPMAEAMCMPGFEAVSWHLIVAPGGTPRPIAEKVHAELRAVTTLSEIHQQMVTMGLIPLDTPSVDELQRFVASEISTWGKVVRQVGIAGTE